MFEGISQGQKIVLGAVAVAAVIGWITAAAVMVRSGDLKDQVAGSEAAYSELAEKFAKAEDDLRRHREATGSLEEITQRLESAQTEQGALSSRLEARKSELEGLGEKTDTGRAQLAELSEQIVAGKSELSELSQGIESARAQLDQLSTKLEQQRELASKAVITAPRIEPTAGATATTAATGGGDFLADAKRRFGAIDQNGDDRIDDVEFRVNKIASLDMIDVNRDSYITLDETLLSPDTFKLFDGDGDAKISQLEFVDAQFFAAIDADKDRLVTFEEYKRFLRTPAR